MQYITLHTAQYTHTVHFKGRETVIQAYQVRARKDITTAGNIGEQVVEADMYQIRN